MNEHGAEAIVKEISFKENKAVEKLRIEKSYRPKELDDSLRKTRTKQESTILTKAKEIGLNVPTVFVMNREEGKLILEKINGKTLSEFTPSIEQMKFLGEQIAKLHKNGIIHADLSTRNILFVGKKKNDVYIIDFGLGFFSKRIEDFAVELLSFKRSMQIREKNEFNAFLEGYCNEFKESDKVLRQIENIASRARYT